MITCDWTTNKGFDFDVNIRVNDENEEYSAEDIKKTLMRAIDQVARPMGFSPCEDSTRVITLKMKNIFRSRIEYSCDFAIVYDYNILFFQLTKSSSVNSLEFLVHIYISCAVFYAFFRNINTLPGQSQKFTNTK